VLAHHEDTMLYRTQAECVICPMCGAEIFLEEELIHEVDLGEVINCPLCEEDVEIEDEL
jgi:hypothetical protein